MSAIAEPAPIACAAAAYFALNNPVDPQGPRAAVAASVSTAYWISGVSGDPFGCAWAG